MFWLNVPGSYFSGSRTNLKIYDKPLTHNDLLIPLLQSYTFFRSVIHCKCIINLVHISLLKLHALSTHFNRVDVLVHNSLGFAMPELSGVITSEIYILTQNYNQSARNNSRTLFEVK